jgi:hypothetical protein
MSLAERSSIPESVAPTVTPSGNIPPATNPANEGEFAGGNVELAGGPAVPVWLATIAAAVAIVGTIAATVWVAIQVYDKVFADKTIYRDLPSDIRRDVSTYENSINEGLKNIRSDIQRFENMSNLDPSKLSLGYSIYQQSQSLANSYDRLADKLEQGVKNLAASGSETLESVKKNIELLRQTARDLRINPFSAQLDAKPEQTAVRTDDARESNDLSTEEDTAGFIADKLLAGVPLGQLYSTLSENSSYFRDLSDDKRDQFVVDTSKALDNQARSLQRDESPSLG